MYSVLACSSTQPTLQVLVSARAEQVAQDAELATRLAVATGAMAAELATFDMAWWLEMEDQELAVHPSVEEVLGLEGPGAVSVDQATGAVLLVWEQVDFTPDVFGRVEFDMLRPQTSAVVRLVQEAGQPPGVIVESRYTLDQAGDLSAVTGVLTLDLADRQQQVVLPLADEVRMVWGSEGGFWPMAGQLSWSETWESAERSLESLPVDQARPKDLVWPVVVWAEDWSNRVELDLSRDGSGSRSVD